MTAGLNVDRLGRRPLLLTGLLSMGVADLVVAVVCHTGETKGRPLDAIKVSNPISCAADRAKFGGDASPKAAAQAYVTNHVYTNFIRSHPGSRLITIPTEYWNATPSPYKKRYNELVEKDTSIYWTGPEVVSPQITNAQATAAKAAHGNRNMLIFDNYPVNDYAPNRLHLGPLTDRDSALTGTVEGITTNQMNQHAPSLIALFTAADFTWNTAAYNPEVSWDQALRELGGKAYPALKVFAENSRSGPLTSTADAGRLKALVAAVWEKPGAVSCDAPSATGRPSASRTQVRSVSGLTFRSPATSLNVRLPAEGRHNAIASDRNSALYFEGRAT
ncbi:beta-N-acetylglucosaminidase domain-containing protein [Streptomyces sp. NBC_00873]|nr:beta-N-acetylglucosaminidase domain-containing protein [Streptomyces sp. NBC_00873]WTA48120.1 beta-N-acetylglucosaminidase domain-containing protein [Streptomyces sp. NBC_00842]